VISYLDKAKDDASQGVGDLRDALRQIAASTDLRHLGDYPPVHEAKLVAALDSIQDAKRLLGPGDKLLLEAPGKNDHQVNLSQTWDPSEVISLEKITTEKTGEGEVILTIRRPDMTGKSKWQFTRGKFAVFAKIIDADWLNAFHGRKVPGFRSGDAMRCKVKFIYIFDERGTMIEERIEVTKVLEIIPGPGGEQIIMNF